MKKVGWFEGNYRLSCLEKREKKQKIEAVF